MQQSDSRDSTDNLSDVLNCARRKGVELWSVDGKLHYRAPKGALTKLEIERLRALSGQIAPLLACSSEPPMTELSDSVRAHSDCAPLSFAQILHWNSAQLHERPAIRHIASATRLRGDLQTRALRQSITAIVLRHEALRTRILIKHGAPLQIIDAAIEPELDEIDLTGLPDSLIEHRIQELIRDLILEPIDVAVGPLFAMRLLHLGKADHVLIVVMEHIISDAYSLGILSRDLFAAYAQIVRGEAIALPNVRMQFAQYANWQRGVHNTWLEIHGNYWKQRLAGCRRLRFPEDASGRRVGQCGWSSAPINIGRELKAELHTWARENRTTIVMVALTVYVAVTLRWCQVSDAVIQYQTDGRYLPHIENTIGFFAAELFLHIQIRDEDNFRDLLGRVTQEYCHAYEHADFSYMAAQAPEPEVARNPRFNWVPQAAPVDLSELAGSPFALQRSPISFETPSRVDFEWDSEPSVLLYDTNHGVEGGVFFPLSRFSPASMELFGRNFLKFTRALLKNPSQRVQKLTLL